jgi:hypothetical protein
MSITIGKPGSPEHAAYLAAFDRQYHPCETGLHVCGIDDDAGLPCGPHFTVLNVPLPKDRARAVFDVAKAQFACTAAEGDVLVDLKIEGDVIADFWMRRQMVEVMERTFSK